MSVSNKTYDDLHTLEGARKSPDPQEARRAARYAALQALQAPEGCTGCPGADGWHEPVCPIAKAVVVDLLDKLGLGGRHDSGS